MRHRAIRALYNTVVTIDDDIGAFDKDGKKVRLFKTDGVEIK